jgi:hypothetical protein
MMAAKRRMTLLHLPLSLLIIPELHQFFPPSSTRSGASAPEAILGLSTVLVLYYDMAQFDI